MPQKTLDFTGRQRAIIDYKELWTVMDNYDKAHLDQAGVWQIRELEIVIKTLNRIHENRRKNTTNTEIFDEITKLKEKFEVDGDGTDDILINRLKDRIHQMWQKGFPDPEDKKPKKIKKTTKPKFNGEKYLKTLTKVEHFTKESFQMLRMDTDKKGDQETSELREHFFGQLLDLINPDLKEGFWLYLHDESNDKFWAKEMLHDIPTIKEAYFKNKISQKQFNHLLNEITSITQQQLGFGEWTYDQPEKYDRFWEEYKLIKDKLDGDYDGCIDCNSSGNCKTRLKLSKKELKDLDEGRGVTPRNCMKHKDYDEYGSSVHNKKLHWYDKDLPETPVHLRILYLDNWLDKKQEPRFHKFIQEHDKAEVVKTENKFDKEIIYVKISDDKTFEEYHKEFKYMSAEICGKNLE